jgi:hypothetical protein
MVSLGRELVDHRSECSDDRHEPPGHLTLLNMLLTAYIVDSGFATG